MPHLLPLVASIKSKDEKVHKQSKRSLRRVHSEGDLAYMGQAAEYCATRHVGYTYRRCGTLCSGFRFPASDDSNLHIVINHYHGREEMVRP